MRACTRVRLHTQNTPAHALSLDALTRSKRCCVRIRRCACFRADAAVQSKATMPPDLVRAFATALVRILGVPLTARAVTRVSTRDRRGLRHSTAVHRADLACSYRRYAAAAYVVTYYPPAPLVVATTASGARLTDMSESAMVRSLTRRWCGFGFLDLALALVHGGSCISVACCLLHASCCIWRARRMA